MRNFAENLNLGNRFRPPLFSKLENEFHVWLKSENDLNVGVVKRIPSIVVSLWQGRSRLVKKQKTKTKQKQKQNKNKNKHKKQKTKKRQLLT